MLSQLPCLGVPAARGALALIGRRPLGWIGSEVLREARFQLLEADADFGLIIYRLRSVSAIMIGRLKAAW